MSGPCTGTDVGIETCTETGTKIWTWIEIASVTWMGNGIGTRTGTETGTVTRTRNVTWTGTTPGAQICTDILTVIRTETESGTRHGNSNWIRNWTE